MVAANEEKSRATSQRRRSDRDFRGMTVNSSILVGNNVVEVRHLYSWPIQSIKHVHYGVRIGGNKAVHSRYPPVQRPNLILRYKTVVKIV